MLRDAAPYLSLIAAICYGIGWIFFTALYSRFDLQPESAGIGPQFLLVRAAVLFTFVLLIVALVVLLSTRLTGMFNSGRAGDTRLFTVILWTAGILLFAISFVGTETFIRYQWHPPTWVSVVSGLIVGLALAMLEVLALLHATNYIRDNPVGAQLGDLDLKAAIAAILIWFIALPLCAYCAGYATGNAVREGYIVENPVASFPVALIEVSNTISAPVGARTVDKAKGFWTLCVFRMGSQDGQYVAYDFKDHEIVSVPTNYVTAVSNSAICG